MRVGTVYVDDVEVGALELVDMVAAIMQYSWLAATIMVLVTTMIIGYIYIRRIT